MADIDGDGDLDLFVGGRSVPGKYPAPAGSTLFRNANGKFEIDPQSQRSFAQVGLVSGAVFSDLDADGDPDLVLACDWGPLKIFRNERSDAFTTWDWPVFLPEASDTVRHRLSNLRQLTGWWNGVATGDFDGDGALDIVASNWGRNTRYERHRSEPLPLFYSDLNGDGAVEIIEAYFNPKLNKIVPERMLDALTPVMPFLKERIFTHQDFGKASVEELLGDRHKAMNRLEASWLESTLFLNRTGRFEARILPVEAQMAPAFAVCVADFDGDAHEDVFLSQNFFATQPETPRYDAGRGLWLRNDGRGRFHAVSGSKSGLKIYGEQRGAAACDYDGDGRVDLVVTQNGAATKLYRNTGGRSGLRVRLHGPAQNPLAIGATLRVVRRNQPGPAREIQAGSGYWSQNSAVQILAPLEGDAKLWVRWPGGKVVSAPLPQGAREVSLNLNGEVKVER
jgi:hypothetical protein